MRTQSVRTFWLSCFYSSVYSRIITHTHTHKAWYITTQMSLGLTEQHQDLNHSLFVFTLPVHHRLWVYVSRYHYYYYCCCYFPTSYTYIYKVIVVLANPATVCICSHAVLSDITPGKECLCMLDPPLAISCRYIQISSITSKRDILIMWMVVGKKGKVAPPWEGLYTTLNSLCLEENGETWHRPRWKSHSSQCFKSQWAIYATSACQRMYRRVSTVALFLSDFKLKVHKYFLICFLSVFLWSFFLSLYCFTSLWPFYVL